MFVRRLVVFMIRKKLGLKKKEEFRFKNQKRQNDSYYFGKYALIKKYKKPIFRNGKYVETIDVVSESRCSLNYLLRDDCEIEKV